MLIMCQWDNKYKMMWNELTKRHKKQTSFNSYLKTKMIHKTNDSHTRNYCHTKEMNQLTT